MATEPESNGLVLRALAERLMCHPHPEGPTSAELFIRRLPDSMVPEIPLPAGARLWGSQLRHLAGRAASMEAGLDVDAEPSALLDVMNVWAARSVLAAHWVLQ